MRLGRRTFLAAAGAGIAAWACSTPPGRFAEVALEPGARLRDVRFDGTTWWACGAVLGTDGVRSPRLWRGAAPDRLTVVQTQPVSYYGERSELYSIGVGALGVVAIGAQTGGFHAMPRSASWLLDGDVLVEQPATMELFGGPRSLALAQACAGAEFVLIGSRADRRTDRAGGCAWQSPDGADFVLLDDAPGLRAEQGEQVAAQAVASLADGSYVAVGDGFATTGSDPTTHAMAWSTADPAAWTRASVLGDEGSRTSMSCVAAGPDGLLAGGTRTAGSTTTLCVWSSPDAVTWEPTPVGGLSTTVDNTVSAVTALTHDGSQWWLGGRLGTQPVLAASPDGRAWYRRMLPAGALASAQVRVALAADHGRLLVGISDLDQATNATWPG